MSGPCTLELLLLAADSVERAAVLKSEPTVVDAPECIACIPVLKSEPFDGQLDDHGRETREKAPTLADDG